MHDAEPQHSAVNTSADWRVDDDDDDDDELYIVKIA